MRCCRAQKEAEKEKARLEKEAEKERVRQDKEAARREKEVSTKQADVLIEQRHQTAALIVKAAHACDHVPHQARVFTPDSVPAQE